MPKKSAPPKLPPPRTRTPFAELLRSIRVSKGLSQIEVAKRGGLGRGYLGMVETGERGVRPSRDSVLRLCLGLDATPDERDALLREAGFPPLDPSSLAHDPESTERSIQTDPLLRDDHRQILLNLYRTLRQQPH